MDKPRLTRAVETQINALRGSLNSARDAARAGWMEHGGKGVCPSARPFMIELFGSPKSGKTTMKDTLKHVFRRSGWRVAAPVEGAEFVELPRDEPAYNLQTTEYAMSRARELSYSHDFHLVIFDRAVMDGIVRMDYYDKKGVITPGEHELIRGYFSLPWNFDLFDLHICLVASPDVSIEREHAHTLTRKKGETMNPKTLQALLDAHGRVWERMECDRMTSMVWHDSSNESIEETAMSVLKSSLDAFIRRVELI